MASGGANGVNAASPMFATTPGVYFGTACALGNLNDVHALLYFDATTSQGINNFSRLNPQTLESAR